MGAGGWSIETPLGADRIERHIPGAGLDALQPLTVVRNPDQTRTAPRLAAMAKGQTAIIITAPHAKPMTGGIEAHQRHQQQIELPGETRMLATQARLGDAKAVWPQPTFGAPGQKPQTPLAPEGPYDRQIAALARTPGPLHQGAHIELAIAWPVEGDAPGAPKAPLGAEPSSHLGGVTTLSVEIERTARGARLSARIGTNRHGIWGLMG